MIDQDGIGYLLMINMIGSDNIINILQNGSFNIFEVGIFGNMNMVDV